MSKGCDARMEVGLDAFLKTLEKKAEEIQKQINKEVEKEEGVREIAHRIWLEAGKPDGDKIVYQYGKTMKLKDVHWELATTEWIYGPDYLKSY